MSIWQLVSSFLVLTSTTWFVLRARANLGLSPLHVIVWASFVMMCVVSFVGVR